MHILFLTSRLPYPPHRGDKLKIFNLMSRLSRTHRLTLLSFIQDPREEDYIPELRRFCSHIHLVHHPRWKSLAHCLAALPGAHPFQVAWYRSRLMQSTLAEVLASDPPDLVHTHLIRMAPYMEMTGPWPRLLDLTDAVSLYLERFLSQERHPLKRLLLREELRRMKRFEPVIAGYDRALVCSDTDRDVLHARCPDASLGLLYNGVDVDLFPIRTKEPSRPHLIFTGNMSYFPNADGAQRLVREIFPRIRAEIPDVTLSIVGGNPPTSVRALAGHGVTVTGFVEDIRAEYADSQVALSPVRFGAGTLNKVLEPLAMGLPVVSTSIGVEGLGLVRERDIFIADAPEDFARAVIRLLQNPDLRHQVGLSVAQRVRERFSWERIVEDLEKQYADLRRGL